MKSFFIFFLLLVLLEANTKSEKMVDKALALTQTDHVYSAIPLLDKALELMEPKGEIGTLFRYAKLEVMLDVIDGWDADYITLCNILKKANKIQTFVFPKMIGGDTSLEKEKEVCRKVQNYSGQEIFDYGTKIMRRTKDGTPTVNSIKHALPYFKLAERKKFNDPELYQMLSLIYFDKANYKKALHYSKLFKKTNSSKGLYEGDVMRIYAISKLNIDGITKDNVKIAIANLKKAKLAGSVESVKLIRELSNILSKSNARHTKCTRVSGDYALWKYCNNGDCSGFSSNYNLWELCKNDDITGMSSNYPIWKYLKNGDVSGFASKSLRVFNSAKAHATSYSDRKDFVIYYLRGFITVE